MLQHRIFRHQGLRPFHLSLFTVPAFLVLPLSLSAQSAHIADNSFLIEEAYNQESGVVQHISTFSRPDGGGAWDFGFTQEWPFRGMRHQLSYTVPVLQADGSGTGVGDILLNYRYQLVGDGEIPLHVAPRLSLILPNRQRGRGTRHRIRRLPDQPAGELRAERRVRSPRECRSHPRE